MQSVSHRNIIAFHDAFIVNKELWLVFEYAEAGDLKRQLRKARCVRPAPAASLEPSTAPLPPTSTDPESIPHPTGPRAGSAMRGSTSA